MLIVRGTLVHGNGSTRLAEGQGGWRKEEERCNMEDSSPVEPGGEIRVGSAAVPAVCSTTSELLDSGSCSGSPGCAASGTGSGSGSASGSSCTSSARLAASLEMLAAQQSSLY